VDKGCNGHGLIDRILNNISSLAAVYLAVDCGWLNDLLLFIAGVMQFLYSRPWGSLHQCINAVSIMLMKMLSRSYLTVSARPGC
jgi:hypothetical protein